MAKFCGGIKLDPEKFKIIDGIITDSEETNVDATKAVSTCGQRWDGKYFTVCDGVITEAIPPDVPVHNITTLPIRGNCGVGLDGRFFKLSKGVVSIWDGFELIVNTTPTDATIKVTDIKGIQYLPKDGTNNVFVLNEYRCGTYTVEVSKTGFTTKTQTITNDKDQTIEVTLEAAGG